MLLSNNYLVSIYTVPPVMEGSQDTVKIRQAYIIILNTNENVIVDSQNIQDIHSFNRVYQLLN